MGTICLLLFLLALWKSPLINQLVYLTYLGNQLSAFTCYFTYYLASTNPTPIPKIQAKGKLFIALFALEYSLVIQVLIVLVYWLLIFDEILENVLAKNDTVIYLLTILIHTLPFLAALSNCLATHFTFVKSHYLYCFIIALIYFPLNYLGTQIKGRPVYPFLRWE